MGVGSTAMIGSAKLPAQAGEIKCKQAAIVAAVLQIDRSEIVGAIL
jgi:hypothetical protein